MRRVHITLLSLIAMAVGFQVWFKDWALTTVVLSSIALHEVGHAGFLYTYSVKFSMLFVPFLGGAVQPDIEQVRRLNDRQVASVVLGGPAVNFILMITGLVMMGLKIGGNYALALVSINAALVYFNLLPFFVFDGGKFASTIYKSLDERQDRRVAILIAAVALIFGVITLLLGKFSYTYLLIVHGIGKKSREDDPADAYSPKAMKTKMAYRMVYLYIIMIFCGLVVTYFMPNWIDLFDIWWFN